MTSGYLRGSVDAAITSHIQHTSNQYLSYPVINTYVQFTVQQFYYFLIFTLRQIFCTKENMRTISKSVSRYPGDVWSSAVEQSKHFQTDLVLLPEPEPKLGPVWCYNYKHETCHIITQSDIKHISTVVLMVCCNTILGLVEIAEILLF